MIRWILFFIFTILVTAVFARVLNVRSFSNAMNYFHGLTSHEESDVPQGPFHVSQDRWLEENQKNRDHVDDQQEKLSDQMERMRERMNRGRD